MELIEIMALMSDLMVDYEETPVSIRVEELED